VSTINTSYKNAAARGTAAFEVMDEFVDANLSAGAEPPMQQPVRILLADSQTLAAFTVVGLSAGKLVKATYNATLASAVQPIGVLVHAASSGSSNTTKYGEVIRTGCFNVGKDAAGTDSPLVWDSSFDTIAKKTTWEGVLGRSDLVFRQRTIPTTAAV